jgi:hypothetical protein
VSSPQCPVLNATSKTAAVELVALVCPQSVLTKPRGGVGRSLSYHVVESRAGVIYLIVCECVAARPASSLSGVSGGIKKSCRRGTRQRRAVMALLVFGECGRRKSDCMRRVQPSSVPTAPLQQGSILNAWLRSCLGIPVYHPVHSQISHSRNKLYMHISGRPR